jgi:acylphosphatase
VTTIHSGTVHIVVRGRVQGVGYRAFVEDEARRCGLAGWVRNRRDGTVEAVFSGPAAAVMDMVDACRNGPLGARVEAIYERDARADELAQPGQGAAFAVLPTV